MIFLPMFLFLIPLFIFPLAQFFYFKGDFVSSIGLLVQGVLFLLFAFLTRDAVRSDGLGIFVVVPFCLVSAVFFGVQFAFEKYRKRPGSKTIAFLSIPFFVAGLIFCFDIVFSDYWGTVAYQAKSDKLINEVYNRGVNDREDRETIFFWLVQNWNTTPDILDKVAHSEYSESLSVYVIQHPRISKELFCEIYPRVEETNSSFAEKTAQKKNFKCE